MSSASVDQSVATVMQTLSREDLLGVICAMVDIPSPTGEERQLADWIATSLVDAGVEAQLQVIDDLQANAVAELRGDGRGESILLYAPLDTYTTGDPELDIPYAGPQMRTDMVPSATVFGDLVVGLAAGNPKGHAAAIYLALLAFSRAKLPLSGDLIAGFGAGGMPSFAVPGKGVPGRENTGHGVGATFMLERGYTTDHAIIAKPGWSVSHEEVGLVWVDVEVAGEHSYAGSRHRMPYQNAALGAALVIQRLEDWLGTVYPDRHEIATMRPQGVVSSVQGGFTRLAASTTASVRIRLDVRLTTEQTPAQVVREITEVLKPIAEEWGHPITARQVAAVPASHTDPQAPIVQETIAAFEDVTRTTHVATLGNSGATDANILRMRGIPTSRVGMPKVEKGPGGQPVDFTLGMNIVDLVELRNLIEILVRTVIRMEHRPR